MPLRKSATIFIEDGPVSPRLGQATLARYPLGAIGRHTTARKGC
jgi:hypothetical protein